MESFNVNNLFHCYTNILYKESNRWSFRRLFINAIIPIFLAFLFLISTESLTDIKEAIALILSILVGLLFNFVSGFSDRISSEHLSQNATQKIYRLELIKETSDGAFVTILLSLIGLSIFVIITLIANISFFKDNIIRTILDIAFGGLWLLVLYQIFLFLVFMINRLRKLILVDTDQEKEHLKSLQERELDEWESLD